MKATTEDKIPLVLSSMITLAVTIIWNLKSNLKNLYYVTSVFSRLTNSVVFTFDFVLSFITHANSAYGGRASVWLL